MAAESLFSVGKTVLEKLGPLLQQEASLLWNLPTELEKLNGTVTAIQALLLDAEEQQKHSHQVRDWLEKLAVLLFDAEDLLDDVATEALRREVAARNQDGADDCNCRIHCRTAVCFLLSIPCRLIYGLKMAHKVKSLREQLDAIYADNNIFHLNPRTEERGNMRKHTNTISSIPDIVVGREDDRKHIKTLLLANDSDVVSVVSIIGIGGMGKTTLAQLIYNDGEIKEEFKMRLWVCVSEAFEVNVIAQNILESATKKKQQELRLNTLIDLLKGELSGKKYLLVLDDVWNFDPEKWDVLRSVLKRGGRGSKILVTTRFENYAKRMMSRGSPSPYTLSGLSSPQSMSLLGQIVFGEQPDDEKLENITNNAKEIEVEIMKKSVGVPLAVKTIANILYFKDPQTEWLPFLRSSELLDAEQESSILHNLKLSYDYLPSHLKHCFLHCSLYPKDNTIVVEELICCWVALGFIKAAPNDSQQNLYDLGLQCFMDLAWRSFFQEIQRGFDEKVRSCKMHDLFHELAISIVGSSYKQITPNPTTNTVSEKTFHVSLIHDLWSPTVLISQLEKAKRLQTFYIESTKCYQGTNWDANSFKSFVSKFPSLRLLCFPNSEMEMLPHHIQELKHLRYLDLAFNLKMTRLPDSITTLQNLQVLALYRCKTLQELPRDINNLVNLWYLDCRHCIALSHMPKGIGKMSHLENLPWFVVGKDDGSVSKHVGGLDELNMLNNLRDHLSIVNLRNIGCSNLKGSSSLVAFKIGESANLKGKFHLQWLTLHWDDGKENIHPSEWEEYLKEGLEKNVEWDECLLNGLQPNLNLTSLGIRACRGGRSPIWISSLTNLVTLSLVVCNMSRHLHDLQGLPVLRKLLVLGLIELEYIDDDDDGTLNKPFFPSLEYLSLSWCPKLKGWRKRQSPCQFPKLSKLTISDCPLITSMPFFPTLDSELELEKTSLQPLLHAVSHCPPTMLQKLVIKDIYHFPKEWLKGMQHLTSLQEIKIEKCSGLDDTLDWHNISHVPDITIDGYYINRGGKPLWDENYLNNFPRILQELITKGINHFPEEWLQVMQPFTSLQEIRIPNSSGFLFSLRTLPLPLFCCLFSLP